jgi:hypothetical protein
MALGIKIRTNIHCHRAQKKFPMVNRETEGVKWENTRWKGGKAERGKGGKGKRWNFC